MNELPVVADAAPVRASAGTGVSKDGAPAVTVSVVVCAYTLDRWDDLVAAVTSLQQQSRPPAEIIVVSDHNPHLFGRVCVAWPHLAATRAAERQGRGQEPDIIALENEEERGLSGARNTAVRAASGGIIAFLDDDAQAEPEWLARLLEAFEDDGVLGVGGAILPAWESGRPAWFPEEFDWVVGCTYKGMPLTRSTQRNLIGANMSFRRELFEAAGDFQTDMGRIGTRPLGCEETELCIRGTQILPGTRYVYEPRAQVHHRVPASRASWRYFVSRCYSEGLSKAQVADRVGAGQGLASERAYTTRTLPAGVLRGLSDAVTGRRPGGLRRSAAIVAGLGITTAGYLRGRSPGATGARMPGARGARASGKIPAEAS